LVTQWRFASAIGNGRSTSTPNEYGVPCAQEKAVFG
jgi:hypothetical protein